MSVNSEPTLITNRQLEMFNLTVEHLVQAPEIVPATATVPAVYTSPDEQIHDISRVVLAGPYRLFLASHIENGPTDNESGEASSVQRFTADVVAPPRRENGCWVEDSESFWATRIRIAGDEPGNYMYACGQAEETQRKFGYGAPWQPPVSPVLEKINSLYTTHRLGQIDTATLGEGLTQILKNEDPFEHAEKDTGYITRNSYHALMNVFGKVAIRQ